MNKAELIEALAVKLGDKKTATLALDAFISEVQNAVAKGDRVALTGFGSWEKRVRNPRVARNPRTGEPVKVKKTSVPVFKVGNTFRELVASGKPAKAAAVKKSTTKAATTTKAAPVTKAAAATKTTAAAKTTAATKTTAAKKTTATKAAATKTATAPKATKTAPVTKTTKAAKTAKAAPAAKRTARKTAAPAPAPARAASPRRSR